MLSGSCLCGAVSFTATETARPPVACHCTQRRKQTGHHWASVQVMDDALSITGAPTWYASSSMAKRGFCSTCGSFLFWKSKDDPDTGISLGALDSPTGLRLKRHIFTADKGDYYDIADINRQEEQEI